jgi:hypothetical protein
MASVGAKGISTSAETSHPGPAGTVTGVADDEEPRRTNADALVYAAEASLSSGQAERHGGERYQLVVHADAAVLGKDPAKVAASSRKVRAPAPRPFSDSRATRRS